MQSLKTKERAPARRWLQKGLFVLLIGGLYSGASAAKDPLPADEGARRTVQDGELLGAKGPYESYVWYNVPYAQPPVGDLRWRAPRPPQPWKGVRDATTISPPCTQIVQYPGVGYQEKKGDLVGTEDCLYLSIWSPRLPPAEAAAKRLPVMFWIHGGGNRIGHGAEYTGAHLAASQNVIVVTVTYRLDFMGWLRHRALRGAGATEDDRSGNYGTLDQIAGLEWVRRNIASFGGDPGKVTIFGESGGAVDVRALLQSPRADGLFQRAIVQSAATYDLLAPAYAENFASDAAQGHPLSSNEILLSLLIADGKAAGARAGSEQIRRMSDEAVATYLRGKTYRDIAAAIDRARKRNARIGLGEQQIGWIRDNNPLFYDDGHVLSKRWQSRVPVMIGSTRDEDRSFLSFEPKYVDTSGGGLRLRDKQRYGAVTDFLSRWWKAENVDEVATSLTRRGNQVYAYRFDWDDMVVPPASPEYATILGAHHGVEVPFVFGTPDLGREMSTSSYEFDVREGSSYRQLSAVLMSYWAQFAQTGDPGRGRRGELPLWSSWPAGGFIVFNTPAKGGVRMSTDRLTIERVLDEANADPRLADPKHKCRFIDDVRGYFLSHLSAAEYHRLGAEKCPKPVDAASQGRDGGWVTER